MEQTMTIGSRFYEVASRTYNPGTKKPYHFEVFEIDAQGRGIAQVHEGTTRYAKPSEAVAAGEKWLASNKGQ